MRVALLNTKPTLRARHILECFAAGVTRLGDEPVWVDDHANFKELAASCDVGVQVCYPNYHKSQGSSAQFRIDVNDYLHGLGKRIVTLDTGFVKNQTEYEDRQAQQHGQHQVLFDLDKVETYQSVLRTIYYSACYDGLKRHGDYCVGKKAADDYRWRQLGTPLQPWRAGRPDQHILLLGQTLFGLSSQHQDIYLWYRDTIRAIRKVTQRPIVFRHHPRIVKQRPGGSRIGKDARALVAAVGTPSNFRRSDNFLLADDLRNCWAAVGFSSNASVTAAIHGVPVFTADESNMAWEVGSHRLDQIERPGTPDRTAWANRLAYSQWTCGEMGDGLCWAHLRPHALKPVTSRREWREGASA